MVIISSIINFSLLLKECSALGSAFAKVVLIVRRACV